MEPFVTPNCTNRDTQELTNTLERVFNSIQKNPLLNSPNLTKTNIFVSGTDLIINHRLGRLPNGFIPVNLNAGAVIYVSNTKNTIPTQQIILKSTANVTADILFF